MPPIWIVKLLEILVWNWKENGAMNRMPNECGARLNSQSAMSMDYQVVLCFIGIASPKTSDQRVAMRVSQGGHDVPVKKLTARFPRTLANLRAAIHALPHLLGFDNEDLAHPFTLVAVFENGKAAFLAKSPPVWLAPLLGQPAMDVGVGFFR